MPTQKDNINIISDRLINGLQPEKIILFGSHAYGTPIEDSDLDLLIVVSDSNQPKYKRARDCYRLLRGIDVSKDIIVLTREEYNKQYASQTTLVRFASQNGITLYERPAA